MLFRSDLEQLDKQSDSLMKKDQMPDTKQDQQNIDNQMNSSSDQLSINQNSKASQSQKNASDQMKQLAEKMESASSASYEQQDELDMDAIKQMGEILKRHPITKMIYTEANFIKVREASTIQTLINLILDKINFEDFENNEDAIGEI